MLFDDIVSLVSRADKDSVVVKVERAWRTPVDPTSNVGSKLFDELHVQQLLDGDGIKFVISWRRFVHS